MEYVHGGDIYTHKGMTDFSVNLNPFGPGTVSYTHLTLPTT